MDKSEALNLINSTTTKPNLIKHMLAVAACMKAIANYLNKRQVSDFKAKLIDSIERKIDNLPYDVQKWEIAGIVHDVDFEKVGDKHPSDLEVKYLTDAKADPEIIYSVMAHGWQITPGCPQPESKMDWALYCCDHLTGLIIATTLVRPSKKIADVDVPAILKKWKNKDFAKGTKRENIALCDEKLGIKLEEFIQICLNAMQRIDIDLGL